MAPQLRSVNRVKCEDQCGKGAMCKEAVVGKFYEIYSRAFPQKSTTK